MDGWAVCGRQLIPIGLLLGELHPSPRDLNQISSVLLVEMFRHVETLGRTIKVEVAFRFHVSPSGTCGRTSKLDSGSARRRGSRFKGSKMNGRAGRRGQAWTEASTTVDPVVGHEILGGIA